MNSLDALAVGALLLAIIGQLWYMRNLLRQLQQLRRSIPPPGQLRTQTVAIPLSELTNTPAVAIAEKYSKEGSSAIHADQVIKVPLLQADVYENARAYRIIMAINSYLVRSRGSVIDFSLIKNVVDRYTQLDRKQVRHQVWAPLLIGVFALLFTGSVGLLLLPNLSDELIGQPVLASTATLFFSSVKWVTLSLLTGALFTLLVIGILYPRARWEVLRRKNELFTLVQAELLPALFQDTTHSLHLLQRSLTSFQHGFADSIGSVRILLDRNYETLKAQERIADALQQTDAMQLSQANADMFQALSKSAEGLDQFRQYLSQMNHFVENTTALNDKVNQFLFRTEYLETIAEKIKETLDKNDRLHHFIAAHFSELEDRGQLITQAVSKIDDILDKSLNELMEHTQHKIRAIRDLSAQEENQLLKTYEENKHVFGKLARIDDLHQDFAAYKAQNLQTQKQMLEQLQILNQQLQRGSGGGILKKLFGK